MDHFGVLDFGLHTSGNSLHAPQQKTIYARTRVDVPPGGNWLFLLQSDDQMELWIDGKLACEFDEDSFRPVTRSARRVKIPVEPEGRPRAGRAAHTHKGRRHQQRRRTAPTPRRHTKIENGQTHRWSCLPRLSHSKGECPTSRFAGIRVFLRPENQKSVPVSPDVG